MTEDTKMIVASNMLVAETMCELYMLTSPKVVSGFNQPVVALKMQSLQDKLAQICNELDKRYRDDRDVA